MSHKHLKYLLIKLVNFCAQHKKNPQNGTVTGRQNFYKFEIHINTPGILDLALERHEDDVVKYIISNTNHHGKAFEIIKTAIKYNNADIINEMLQKYHYPIFRDYIDSTEELRKYIASYSEHDDIFDVCNQPIIISQSDLNVMKPLSDEALKRHILDRHIANLSQICHDDFLEKLFDHMLKSNKKKAAMCINKFIAWTFKVEIKQEHFGRIRNKYHGIEGVDFNHDPTKDERSFYIF